MAFTLFLTEPSRAVDGWTFQLFIDADNLSSTGYGSGIEFVTGTNDFVDNEYLAVRSTATSDGPGGWGTALTTALLTVPNDTTVIMEIPLSPNVLPSGFVNFGFEVYLDGRLVDGVRNQRTSLVSGGTECLVDYHCEDNLFCTGVEICVNGSCQTTIDPCPGQLCDNTLGRCIECITDVDCADELFCNGDEWCDTNFTCQPGLPRNCNNDGIACTTNDYCDEDYHSCNGIPDDALCADRFACVPFVGCTAIDSTVPIVAASGARFISVNPQPRTSIVPVSIFVTSSTWPCLGKYVGPPIAQDFDSNGSLDGTIAGLVDNPLDAVRLAPNDWTGKACNNMAPSCIVDADCGNAEKCLPIKRCDQSLLPCDLSGDCPIGENCVNAQLHITGYEIIPSTLDDVTSIMTPVLYSLAIDSAGYASESVSVEMAVFGDVNMNHVVNAADINMVIKAFQRIYHLPVGSPYGTILPAVDQSAASLCRTSLPVVVTISDILITVKAFQNFSFAYLAGQSGCPALCP